jgi:5-(hydroxymethyl)furfural/furfural oxidase
VYDYLILGGGAAGCVLASRLSEQPGVSVLLVEGGKDVSEGNVDPDIRSNYPAKAYFNPEYTWPGQTALLAGNADSSRRVRARYEQARILGGGTSINGMIANRGAPSDYDEWEALGATGWNWNSVLPYFRKMERDLDFGGEYHGKDGPFAISRFPKSDWSGFVRAVTGSLRKRGYPELADQNAEWRDGFMRTSVSADEKRERVTCALAYLPASVRARPNLTILTGTLVHRIAFDGVRAVGAQIERDGATELVKAREVLLTCGTIYSPTVLMRSGVGPVDRLQQLGIPVVASLPGIGRNLIEHPVASVSCYLRPEARLMILDRHHTQAHFRFSSGLEGCPAGDMCLAVIARSGWHAVGQRVGSLYLWVNKSYSQGSVAITSPDAHVRPEVDFQMLTDPRDLARLMNGFRMISDIAASPDLDGVRTKVFPTNYSDRVRKVSRPGRKNAIQMAMFATLLDALPATRGWLIDHVVTSGATMRSVLSDDRALEVYLRQAVAGVWHPVGTCRMGRPGDPLAVTGPSGKVNGLAGLRICDASVMPSIPSANTQVPTIMLAERMADLIKSESREGADRLAMAG